MAGNVSSPVIIIIDLQENITLLPSRKFKRNCTELEMALQRKTKTNITGKTKSAGNKMRARKQVLCSYL